ncbi:DoxX family protein [Candidatus Parcubacteria bacterium]|nr:DoxX family protein [Candidatus Parcubacteria bacterium]
MLNTFPSLLTYSLLAPFVLRVILGLIFLDLGILKLGKEKSRWVTSLEALHLRPAETLATLLGAIEIVGGIMLLVGIYTQVAALAFVILTGIELYLEWKDAVFIKRNLVFYLLLLAIALSLLLTGAGAYSFDIPL